MDQSLPFIELCGAIHMHTRYSDGGVSISTMIETAKKVGLDYLVVTDHFSLKGRTDGFEGFHDKLFALFGYEHHDSLQHHHYLALGVLRVFSEHTVASEYVSAIKKSGGVGIIAHPHEHRHFFKKYPPYPWTDWSITGFDGIEIWNQMSEWMENLRWVGDFLRLMYPRRFLRYINPLTLAVWDTLNRERFVSGIGGVDAHTMRIWFGIFPITIFPLKVEFKAIRTHIYLQHALSSDASIAKQSLLSAIKAGHAFISNYRQGDACGTRILLIDKSSQVRGPGLYPDPVLLPAKITVSIPRSAEIILIRNGNKTNSVHGTYAEFPITSTGIYRIEVHTKNHGWIYSNPFPVGAYPV